MFNGKYMKVYSAVTHVAWTLHTCLWDRLPAAPRGNFREAANSYLFRTGGVRNKRICRLRSDQRRKSPSCLMAPISSHRTTGVFFDSADAAAD